MAAEQSVLTPSTPCLEDLVTAVSTKLKRSTNHPPPEVWTVSADGHFVGSDGFVVPRDYAEFIAQHPQHVRNRVRLYMPGFSVADQEDRESELHIHLMTVPDGKYREPGFNGYAEGCTDRIQTFHPERGYGASKARFLHFVNSILKNGFIKMAQKSSKRSGNPIERVNNLVYFEGQADKGSRSFINDESLHYMVTSVRRLAGQCQHVLETGAVIQELVDYVSQRDPDLVAVLFTFLDSDTYTEAQVDLGLSDQLFSRARKRLDILIACWSQGIEPPRQRKVYRPRANKSAEIAA